jgi:hypothetical protein
MDIPKAHSNHNGNASHPNERGIDLCVQTERPDSLHIRGWKAPSRAKAYGAALAAEFGGTWRYVPGHGCPGGWSADGLSADQMIVLADAFDATIVVCVYGDAYPVPAGLEAYPAYRHGSGYYSVPVS